MKNIIISFIFTISFASPVHADSVSVANTISYITVGVNIGLDTVHSFKSEDRKKAFIKQGLRLGSTIGESELLKFLIHETRPDGSDSKSFPSEHTAISSSSQGWNYKFGVTLTIGTASGRIVAKKHNWWDTLAGAGIGMMNDYLVNKFVH